MDQFQLTIAMQNDEINALRQLVNNMREGLQTLYAMRGEDELVSDICNPLIEKSRVAL
jgi:hypothetical protein